MAEFRLETERLVLRDWRDADRAPMFAHLNSQPDVMRWLFGTKDRAASDAMIDRLTGWQMRDGHTFWALERREDAALLGFCGLKRVESDGGEPDPGTLEIGWRLRADAWGRGYAREAAVASMNHAFDSYDEDFLSAFTVKSNTPSWGLMERLGMTRRADLDYWQDDWGPELGHGIVYRITRAQWAAKRKEFA